MKTVDDIDMNDTIDDAADTLRFVRPDFDFDFDGPTHPNATSIFNLAPSPTSTSTAGIERRRRHRQIRDTRENLLRLHEALAAGWDIGPELAHEERRLAALEACS